MKRLLMGLLLLFAGNVALASDATAGIFRIEVEAGMEETYRAVYAELEENRFWVVFEVDLLASISRFKEKWGDDYNRSGLEGLRTMVVCNGWYANQVTGLDPNLAALCPLRVALTHKGGKTAVLFVRPTVVAAGSPGLAAVQEIEDAVIRTIQSAIAKVRQGHKANGS